MEGLIEPIPHPIVASMVDSLVKVLHDIVAHNIDEINEQQRVTINDEISKEKQMKIKISTISIML